MKTNVRHHLRRTRKSGVIGVVKHSRNIAGRDRSERQAMETMRGGKTNIALQERDEIQNKLLVDNGERGIKRLMLKENEILSGKLPKRVPHWYYYALEDANYHKLNDYLTKKGLFGKYKTHVYSKKDYGKRSVIHSPSLTEEDGKQYGRYRKLGGKTWGL